MKDMSMEELEYGMKLIINSDAVDLIGKMAITNTWNELLRRYEVLEKSNKELRDRLDNSWKREDKINNDVLKLSLENHSLKCCGNCKWRRFTLMGDYCHEYCSVEVLESSGYCPQWQSDGMTRKERAA